MKNIKFDSILLFTLVIPFIMTYSLSPSNTPFWLFGLIFLGLIIYIVVDLDFFKIRIITGPSFKNLLSWVMVVGVIWSVLFSAIVTRHQSSIIYGVHDIILQQEAAIKFLVHGINPYSVTYFNTPLLQWHYSDSQINPALYHFVMEPFYLIFAVPFYLVLGHTLGFFDARIPLFILFITLLIFIWKTVKEDDQKRTFMILMALNPATLSYFIEGRDDIFMYVFLFAAFYFLQKKKILISVLALALAFATKQSAWPIFPFFAAFLYFKTKSIKKTIVSLVPFLGILAILIAPFFFWNPYAFLDSTIFYLSGSTQHSYPIAGYGIGALFNQLGLIKNVNGYYPFWILQVIIALPLLLFFIYWQKRNNTVKKLIIIYGIFLFVFWYLSRYFNNSHLGYLSMVFITAYFWPEEDKTKQT